MALLRLEGDFSCTPSAAERRGLAAKGDAGAAHSVADSRTMAPARSASTAAGPPRKRSARPLGVARSPFIRRRRPRDDKSRHTRRARAAHGVRQRRSASELPVDENGALPGRRNAPAQARHLQLHCARVSKEAIRDLALAQVPESAPRPSVVRDERQIELAKRPDLAVQIANARLHVHHRVPRVRRDEPRSRGLLLHRRRKELHEPHCTGARDRDRVERRLHLDHRKHHDGVDPCERRLVADGSCDAAPGLVLDPLHARRELRVDLKFEHRKLGLGRGARGRLRSGDHGVLARQPAQERPRTASGDGERPRHGCTGYGSSRDHIGSPVGVNPGSRAVGRPGPVTSGT